MVGRDVDGVGGGVVFDSQTQIGDGRRAVLLHQDVFGLQVSVSDGRFSWVDREPHVTSLEETKEKRILHHQDQQTACPPPVDLPCVPMISMWR